MNSALVLTSRGPRRVELVAIYSLGLTLGALISGTVIWVASGFGSVLPEAAAAGIAVSAAVLGLARDIGVVSFPLPENRRLVPQEVFHRGRELGALRFGIEMGTGVRTYVPSTTPYVLCVALIVFAPGFVGGVLPAALGFAAGRATVPWSRVIARHEERWDRRLSVSAGAGLRVSAAAMVVLMFYLLP